MRDHLCLSPPNEPGSNFIATTLAEYRAKHHYQRGAAALRRLLESVPVYVMWDDHEVKNNFSGPFEPQMPAGRQAFATTGRSRPTHAIHTACTAAFGTGLIWSCFFWIPGSTAAAMRILMVRPRRCWAAHNSMVARGYGWFERDMESHCHECAIVRSEGRRAGRAGL